MAKQAVAKKIAEGVENATPLPGDMIKTVTGELIDNLRKRAVSAIASRLEQTTERLTEYANSGGEGGLLRALKGDRDGEESSAKGDADSLEDSTGDRTKVTNIVESIDVGVPIDVAWREWTRYEKFPSFMKKVEKVERTSEDKLSWTAKVMWSRRTWESKIVELVPEERIVWRSSGAKGYVDGAVSFHELAPNLTRILVVLEYNPHGFFERVGNIWRAQGRRARLELKHFQRYVMTTTALHPDRREDEDAEEREQSEDQSPDRDEGADRDDADEQAEEEDEDEPAAEADEDETDEEEEAPPPPRRRRRKRA